MVSPKPQDVGLHPTSKGSSGSGRRALPPLRPHTPSAAVLIRWPAACVLFFSRRVSSAIVPASDSETRFTPCYAS